MMAKNFTSTLEKMFIVNPSFIFSGMWSIVKSNSRNECNYLNHNSNLKRSDPSGNICKDRHAQEEGLPHNA